LSIHKYLEAVNKHYLSGHATEHSYRGDFAELLKFLAPKIHVTNEPSNVTDCGNPDYVVTQNDIPIGFIEAKDLGKDLNSKQFTDQFGRYKKALDNLIITDYVWFQFFQRGELVHETRIADIEANKLKPLPENFDEFTNLVQNFCTFVSQSIKSPKTLAEMMAAKARLLESILEKAITTDENNQDNTELQQQYSTFKEILIHDLTPQDFADIYAQTLAYGMFAARLHDKTLDTFSRQEAAELIPKSNPFLRKLFEHLAGANIDERIITTVDNLANVFRATNVEELLKNFGKSTQTRDPIIHFYETFLSEYDPKLRKSRGVWYTPEPVVKFIVRSVDTLLETEFNLKDGLADISKTMVEVEVQGTAVTKGRAKGKKLTKLEEVHKVQVLDPATGTGTFLAEVIKFIYNKNFKSLQGAWGGYVEEHLLPRINGFELLMASYAMAHLKLDMLLTETGYESKLHKRFNIFLTNSLEEHHPDTGTLFSSWLSAEANEANRVKRDRPVMVVLGNPPYSVSSSNKSEWMEDLLKVYKEGVKAKNIQPLSDDYIKFIRYGQHLIEQNGEGVLAYISNNSFIDGLIHQNMRRSLSGAFNQIYILDLHGNYKKKEKSPDGDIDENVFDIQQGVSINLFVKKKNCKEHNIYKYDLYGTRESKYTALLETELKEFDWKKLDLSPPKYFFKYTDQALEKKYSEYISLEDIFIENGAGVQTKRDKLFVDIDKASLGERVARLLDDDFVESEKKFYNVNNSSSYNLIEKSQAQNFNASHLVNYNYRVFDDRYIYYDKDLLGRAFYNIMQNMLQPNIGLIVCKQQSSFDFQHCMVTNKITDHNSISLQTREASYFFPLYLQPEACEQGLGLAETKRLNLASKPINRLLENTGLSFDTEHPDENELSPLEILDYIYAILYAPNFRSAFKDYLKVDFPHIPKAKDLDTFREYARLGASLRSVHLMDLKGTELFRPSYPVSGSNILTRSVSSKDWELYDPNNNLGRIWINETQYFEGIPLYIWEFYIGGYQPAQKWLKDRKDRTLSFDDIVHYQNIIAALVETDSVMHELNNINFE
jgi:predicted helicase